MIDRFATSPNKANSGGKITTQQKHDWLQYEGTFCKKVLPNSVIQYYFISIIFSAKPPRIKKLLNIPPPRGGGVYVSKQISGSKTLCGYMLLVELIFDIYSIILCVNIYSLNLRLVRTKMTTYVTN